jgi:hypothetical protein
MESKTFEIRDAGTFIPVLAIKLSPGCEPDRFLLGRAGYGIRPEKQAEYVMLCKIDGGEGFSTCDPYAWPGGARTFPVAHRYIIEHFDEMESGAVVDVEFVLGITKEPKTSERLDGVPYH